MKSPIRQAIEEEIKWCHAHRENDEPAKTYQKGFIAGLRQALRLVKEAERQALVSKHYERAMAEHMG